MTDERRGMARPPRTKFAVHDLDDDEIPERSQTTYSEVVSKVARTGRGQRLQCGTLSDTEAVYAGVKRAVGNQTDPNDFDFGMSTTDHYVYVRLA